MSDLQPKNSNQQNEGSAPQQEKGSKLKAAAMWGLIALTSAGIGTGIRAVRHGLSGTEPVATRASELLSTVQKNAIIEVSSRLATQQGTSLEKIQASYPAGYLEPKLSSLINNAELSKSVGEFVAIGRPAIPFLEKATQSSKLYQSEVCEIYMILGEIGGDEAASSILRIFNQRAQNPHGQNLMQELPAFLLSMASSNCSLGDELIKEILTVSDGMNATDSLVLKAVTLASLTTKERAVHIDKLEEIALDQSYPSQMRSHAVRAILGRDTDTQKLERIVLKLLENEKDPLFQTAVSLAGTLSRPEALPYVIEAALSDTSKIEGRISAVEAIGSFGAQKYAPDLINLFPSSGSELDAQIVESVLSIGTAENLNQLMQKCAERKDIWEGFPCKKLTERLSESARMATACRPSLEIALKEVFRSNSAEEPPIVKGKYSELDLLDTMLRCELRTIMEQCKGEGLESSAYLAHGDSYRESLSKLIFQLAVDRTQMFGVELEGIGLLAPFASKEALHLISLGNLGYSETELAVHCLLLTKDSKIKEELARIANAPETKATVRNAIASRLKLEKGIFFERSQRPTTPAPSLTEETKLEDLSDITIPPLGASHSPTDDFFSAPITESLDQALSISSRNNALQRIIFMKEERCRELLPLLQDPADAIRVSACCTLAKQIPRRYFSDTEIKAIDSTLIEGVKRYLNGDYSGVLSTIRDVSIEQTILAWKSPAVIEFLCVQLAEVQQESKREDIRRLLNPLLVDESDFNTFADHLSQRITSLPLDDPYAKTLSHRLELLHGTRAVGLEQPFRFSDLVQQTIVKDMQPSQDDRRPAIVLSFAEADHNQAAVFFNRQIEELIKKGFRILVMEPGSRTELEESSQKLKELLDMSGQGGVAHIFQFGHGQTEELQLSERGDIADNIITTSDATGLPQFSKLLAPEGGVTLLSCSTGGQIVDETNLLSYFRAEIFPHAAQGHIRAPVLPTDLSRIILIFSESGDRVKDVVFPVQTSGL